MSKKQGSLFSFFSKKAPAAAPPQAKAHSKANSKAPAPAPKAPLPPPPTTTSTVTTPSKVAPFTVGQRVSIFYPSDSKFYPCTITKVTGTRCAVEYDDRATETVDFQDTTYKHCETTRPAIADGDESMDEEAEFEDEDGSFKGDVESSSDEDEDMDDFVVDDDALAEDDFADDFAESDDDDDKPAAKRSRLQKGSKVTKKVKKEKSRVSFSPKSTPSAPKTPAGAKTPNPLAHFSVKMVSTPSSAGSTSSYAVTPSTPNAPRAPSSLQEGSAAIPFKDGTVNPMGAHLHNHLPFLRKENLRDAAGVKFGEEGYNPRTLKWDRNVIEKVGSKEGKAYKLTDGKLQWWEIKAQYFDTVLLFKTGKFYEMFHMDSDIGFEVLGFNHMKGSEGHAGAPEAAYSSTCEKLVAAGYKVARVEQTETPDQLAIRKKNTKGKKPGVVNREVCAVVTGGTRTFCFMSNTSCFSESNEQGTGVGPLLTISEIMLEQPDAAMSDDSDDAPPAVCEYGVAIVNAVHGSVTLGQFADDKLRSRLHTLLSTTNPAEIVLETTASADLRQMIKNNAPLASVEYVNPSESLPPSRAMDSNMRALGSRPGPFNPWDGATTVAEMHRKKYFPSSSKTGQGDESRWPKVLLACIEGHADLALSALGGGLFYLQRSLVDYEILSMAEIRAYVPPTSTSANVEETANKEGNRALTQASSETQSAQDTPDAAGTTVEHMQLDGITLENLEILANQSDGTACGSLWGVVNRASTPHGQRLLRGWLLRPLFKKEDIDRRADAVAELVSGSPSLALTEARPRLKKVGDIERFLSRVHSMGNMEEGHPANRQVLYEHTKYNKRKVEDFSKLLKGLEAMDSIISIFKDVKVTSPLLAKVLYRADAGGAMPVVSDKLRWFKENFDAKKAIEGEFEPAPGIDDEYDQATADKEACESELKSLQQQYIQEYPAARGQFKYINLKKDQKDKYLIELPVSVKVGSEFIVKGKRGTGSKQVCKYYTREVESAVKDLEDALKRQKEGKSRGLEAVFKKFDADRALWNVCVQVSSMLDALSALAEVSSQPGMTRPVILSDSDKATVNIMGGRHPCVQTTHSGDDFVPNDASLGGDGARVLLLSGPNMGGKSTLLRQTCLISIMAQIGMFVPATSATLTPFDRIFTRLGSSDKILAGQSTFFVELSECAAALRGATSRSFVIMDELGRGTSTFDGTAIAHAVIKHLVYSTQCLTMFATHYHSLLEDMEGKEGVRLGHMQCHVEDDGAAGGECEITFLYQLAEGACPESFGINVARLAALPEGVLRIATEKSAAFENEMAAAGGQEGGAGGGLAARVKAAVRDGNVGELKSLWEQLQ